MKKYLFYTIAFLCLQVSCKKESQVLLNGTVTDLKTGESISNVTINLYETEPGLFGNDKRLLQTSSTDNNGKYVFNTQKVFNETNGYIFQITRENYFDKETSIGKNEITLGSTNTKNFQIQPKGFLRVYVKNITPFDSLDRILIHFEDPISHIGSGTEYDGNNIDNIYFTARNGNESTIISWSVKKNNIWTDFQEISVYCPRFLTTDFTINF